MPKTDAKLKTKKKTKKAKVGRRDKYKKDYVEQVFKLCLLGAIDTDIADFFEVDVSSFYRWQRKYPEFRQAIKDGKVKADANVAASLYKRANGYNVDSVKIFQFQGNVIQVPFVEEIAPDVSACLAWLKNRQKENWRDKQDFEINGNVVLFSGEHDLED